MVEIRELERALRAELRGDVGFGPLTRAVYATDASIYEEQPVGAVSPRDASDVCTLLEIARRFDVSVVARGGGTSLAGQTTGPGIVVDFSPHMNRILEIDPEGRRARVQPGVVLDDLNRALKPHGLHFAPDPATSNRATIGGMIANNSSGTRSIRYGKTVDHVLETRVVLADGADVTFGPMTAEERVAASAGEDRAGRLHRDLHRIVDENRALIEERFPRVMRRVSGYHLDELLRPAEWNVAKVVTGSEGTLALVVEAVVNLVPLPAATGLALVHFDTLLAAVSAVGAILEHDPSAVEILDGTFLRLARRHPTLAAEAGFIVGDPEAILITEFTGEDRTDVEAKLETFARAMAGVSVGIACPTMSDDAEQRRVWTLRKHGLAIMQSLKGDRKPIPFIEDAAVPVEHLPAYIEHVLALCRRLGVEVAMYAHASVGVIHVRPILDLKEQADIERMKVISQDAMETVKAFGGSWSGEHGDGRVRSPHLTAFFGEELMAVFAEVKRLFDPDGRLNPGKILEPEPLDSHLRYGAGYETGPPPARYRYREGGSFLEMVEMCSGVGACRKTDAGTMCPSYMATRDEAHSTRGRANVLRLALNGRLGDDQTLTDAAVRDALELCLSCKACKTECPNGVDMSKLKSEVWQLRHERHGVPLRDRMVGASAGVASLATGWRATVANRVLRSGLGRRALARVGFSSRRSFPPYARQTFTEWFAARGRGLVGGRPVALFVDTYLNHHEPEVGRAAVHALEGCNFDVRLADVGCCQRPRISNGFLDEAARDGRATLEGLRAIIDEDVPVVVCEPSCASSLLDDLPDLVDDISLARAMKEGVRPIETFLADPESSGGRRGLEPRSASVVHVHGHCHQKALFGTSALRNVLTGAGLTVHELDTGCCGMAGAFGYLEEHYDLSMKIGEDRLFPAVRSIPASEAVIACGFSCRHQIADGLGRRATHWVEAVRPVD